MKSASGREEAEITKSKTETPDGSCASFWARTNWQEEGRKGKEGNQTKETDRRDCVGPVVPRNGVNLSSHWEKEKDIEKNHYRKARHKEASRRPSGKINFNSSQRPNPPLPVNSPEIGKAKFRVKKKMRTGKVRIWALRKERQRTCWKGVKKGEGKGNHPKKRLGGKA